jgi:hypothetical protein
MLIRKRFVAATAAVGLLAAAAPVGAAQAYTFPIPAGGQCGPGANTFVPPAVAPISVNIGPIIIQGRLMNPAMNVASPGIAPTPICWTPLW